MNATVQPNRPPTFGALPTLYFQLHRSRIRKIGILIPLIFCSYLTTLTHQDTQKQPRKQQMREHLTQIPDFFYTPLEYIDESFKFFFNRIYNHRRYPQDFLALNFIHVLSGLALAPQADQPRRYVSGLFYLFDRKLQGVYVNPYAFCELLGGMPALIAPFCNVTKEKADTIAQIKECVGAYLVDNYKNLQAQPDKALNDLAASLYDLTISEHDISIKELQHSIHYFLSRVLCHLVWSPGDQIETWIMVKKISCQLEKCHEYYMLDEEMLDDLFWALLQRYAFFIELCAADLQQPFFDGIYYDLRAEKAALWHAPEREKEITTKLAYLQNALMEAEIKSRASGTGILVN